MKYLLDTNACVRFLNRRSESLIQRLSRTNPKEIAVCSVVKAELFFGAMKSRKPIETLKSQQAFLSRFVSLPFDDHAAEEYGRIRAELEKAGTPIGPNDLMIASIASANGVTLITDNTREFSRVNDLLLENWET